MRSFPGPHCVCSYDVQRTPETNPLFPSTSPLVSPLRVVRFVVAAPIGACLVSRLSDDYLLAQLFSLPRPSLQPRLSQSH